MGQLQSLSFLVKLEEALHPLLESIIKNIMASEHCPHRSLAMLDKDLKTILDYNSNIYKHFENRIIRERDFKNFCGGIFAEIIVTAFYIRKGFEIEINEKEADLILRIDKRLVYLEILSINPNLKGEVWEIKTHLPIVNTSSVRGKLWSKLGRDQNQFKEGRTNVAVIELNNPVIAGNFHVQSSLSDGYKVTIDKKSMEVVGGGFDWQSNNFFETEDGKKISAIIWFDMGDYGNRRKIKNPNATCLIDDITLEKL